MALTTLPVCPQKTAESTTRDSLFFRTIVLGLVVLCLPLFTGCGAEGDPGPDAAFANPGNGKGNGHGVKNATTSISLSSTGLAFTAIQGGSDPAAQTVTISDSGPGTLDWSVSTTATWLSLSPISGTAPSSFTATVNMSGLVAGTYSTIITVSAVGATNTPQSIPVDLTISTSTTSSPTTTASVSLAWSPNTDPSVVGYYVHYGMQSANSAGSCTYSQSIYYSLGSLPNASSPTATVSGLTLGTTYFFAVSASNGLEGACSNEVSKTM